jgi:hypothetical protein
MVRMHHKEIGAPGSLIAIKNAVHEVQSKMNKTVLKEDLKKVQD